MANQRQYSTHIMYEKTVTQYCFYCGKKMAEWNKTIDHIRPLGKGGSNRLSNLVISCKKCNNLKGRYSISELIEQLQKQYRFADAGRKKELDKQIAMWKEAKDRLKELEV